MELNRVYCEDNMESAIPNEFLDMVITSPPYGDARIYNGYIQPDAVYWTLEQLHRMLKTGGVIIWVVADQTKEGSETGESFKHALAAIELGFRLHDTMVFAKNNPMPCDPGKRYRQCFEYMFCFSKGTPKTFNPLTEPTKESGKTYQSFRATQEGRANVDEGIRTVQSTKRHSNIFYYTVGGGKWKHPAVFPEQLVEDQIRTWTNHGDIVYDPYMGSGTVAVIAEKLGRRWIGSEVNPDYCKIIEQRLDNNLGV